MATASADAPLKGVKYLLEAFAICFKNIRIRTGLGWKVASGRKYFDRLIKDLNLSSRISFVSGINTPALVKMYAQATLVIVPSVYEGFGLPAGEAMSCGVAVVSTDGGALPEIVGDSAMIVPTRDAKHWLTPLQNCSMNLVCAKLWGKKLVNTLSNVLVGKLVRKI